MMDIYTSLLVIGFILLVIFAIIKGGRNRPTWTGIIISAIIGCLPFYLFLCFFGLMGDREPTSKANDEL